VFAVRGENTYDPAQMGRIIIFLTISTERLLSSACNKFWGARR